MNASAGKTKRYGDIFAVLIMVSPLQRRDAGKQFKITLHPALVQNLDPNFPIATALPLFVHFA